MTYYDLLNNRNINYNTAIKERIYIFANKTSTVRKDAVVLCNMIVTSDEKTMKAMETVKQREFFEDSLKFFGDLYRIGVGKTLVSQIKYHYRNYLYLLLLAESKNVIGFYQKSGFHLDQATPLVIMHH